MKKLILCTSILVLAAAAIPTKASGERYDPRVDVARLADEGRDHHDDWRGGRENRLGGAIADLNRDVRRIREDLRSGSGRDRRLRPEFERIARGTNRLNYEFRRDGDRRDLWRRTQELRGDLARIERELRGHRSWRR